MMAACSNIEFRLKMCG